MAVDLAYLDELESQHSLPPGLLKAVMRKESGGDPNALSPKGAQGYFQFMPATAEAYGVTDPADFKQSATGAARYFADLNKQYSGDLPKMLAAYNAGPTAVAKYQGVPPYPETQNYVQSIMGKISEDTPIDPDSIPVDPDTIDSGKWGGEGNKRPAPRDPFRKIDSAISWIEPTVGSVAGGVAGGTFGAGVGSGIAPGPGTAAGAVVGGAAGAGVGNFIGTLAAISRAQANGELSDIPVDQKLRYAARSAGIDFGSSLVMGAALTKLMPVISKFFKPNEMTEVEEFFKQQGLSATRPEVGPMASFATKSYQDVAKEMKQAVQKAVTEVTSNEAGIAGNPTKAGTLFQDSISKAHDQVSKYVDPLFDVVKRGSVLGDTMKAPNAEITEFAKKWITEYKAQNAWNTLNKTARDTLEQVSAGKPVSLADWISLKRGIYKVTDFAAPGQGVVERGLDQKVKTELTDLIDKQVIEGLRPYPKASGEFQKANRVYSEMMGDLRSETMMKMVKQDPLSVADYVARNASPTVMNEFEDGLKAMVRTGAMTFEERNALRAGVRQNWIIQNLGTPDKAAELGRALDARVMNPAMEQTFNYVFRDSPQAMKAVYDAARAAAAIQKFVGEIPPSTALGPGTYSVVGAAGGMLGNAVGGGVGGLVGSASSMAALKFFTGTLPRALARAATNDDAAILNRIRAVSGWMSNNAAGIGAGSQIPNSILEMMRRIEASTGNR